MNNNTNEAKVKECFSCKKEFPADSIHFHNDSRSKDGLYSSCKDCRNARHRKKNINDFLKAKEGCKFCSGCKRELPADLIHFRKHNTTIDGLEHKCKECRGFQFGVKKIKEVIKAREGYKICTGCRRELLAHADYFYKLKSGKYGLDPVCKECKGRSFGKKKVMTRDGYRTCSKCLKELPATREYFGSQPTVKDNCKSACKVCDGVSSYGIKAINQSFKAKEGHKFCSVCHEELPFVRFNKCKDSKDGHYSQCKDCYKETCKRSRSKPEIKAKKRKYAMEYRKKYYATEHGKRINAVNCQRRKHRKQQALELYSAEIWKETLENFKYECAYCGGCGKLQQEHVIPLSKGGSYTRANIIPACQFCNGSKHDYDLEEWYPKQEFFDEDRLKKIHKWIGYNEKDNSQQLSIL